MAQSNGAAAPVKQLLCRHRLSQSYHKVHCNSEKLARGKACVILPAPVQATTRARANKVPRRAAEEWGGEREGEGSPGRGRDQQKPCTQESYPVSQARFTGTDLLGFVPAI